MSTAAVLMASAAIMPNSQPGSGSSCSGGGGGTEAEEKELKVEMRPQIVAVNAVVLPAPSAEEKQQPPAQTGQHGARSAVGGGAARPSPAVGQQLQKESVAVGSLLQLAATAALIRADPGAMAAPAAKRAGASMGPPQGGGSRPMSQQWGAGAEQAKALRARRDKRRADSAPAAAYDIFSRLRNLPSGFATNHLLLMRHAYKCKSKQCTVEKCAFAKQLWAHINRCKKTTPSGCRVELCLVSRALLSHYWRCDNSRCKLCTPVRESVVKEVCKRKFSEGGGKAEVDNGYLPDGRKRRYKRRRTSKARARSNTAGAAPGVRSPEVREVQNLLTDLRCTDSRSLRRSGSGSSDGSGGQEGIQRESPPPQMDLTASSTRVAGMRRRSSM